MPDFQRIFESAPGLYLVLLPDDPMFTIVAASGAYLSATMTSRPAILGRGIFDVFPDNPDDPSSNGVRNLGDSLRRALAEGKSDAMAIQKYDIRRPDAEGGGFETRYWSPVNSPVFDETHAVVYLVHRVEDVTEFIRLKERNVRQDELTAVLRDQAERMESEVFLRARELQEANRQLRDLNLQLARLRERESTAAREALQKSERRYRTLVSATSSIVWTRDPDGAFIAPQPSWSAYTGQSWDQYKGWGWLDAIHPEDRTLVRERWREVAANRQTFLVEARIWCAAKNGYRFFAGRGAPVLAADGSVEEWIGTVTDIDDRKRLEEQLRHSAKLESLGILAGGIAHDFNNLLTGILSNASQALETFEPKNPADRVALERIVEAGERAAHLTRQMLAYSGKGSFLVRQVDLSALVRDIGALIESSVPKNVRLNLRLRDGLPPIDGDPGQLQQVVMNLIINGGEAIGPGAPGSVTVTTSAQDVDAEYARNFDSTYTLLPGPYIALEVYDTGSGMTEETKRRIFDPFFTTKTHGRGLGLSAVLGIVRGHKGALRVYSEPGRGTTFKALFPVSASPEQPSSMAMEKTVPPAVQPAPRQGLVLIIDDEELIGKTIQSCLVRFGYSCLIATDGAAGVDCFRDRADEISLIILDLTMPRLSGDETFRRLRAIRPQVPVILSSGYNQVEATRKFVGQGLASFLPKPFTIQKLLAAVNAALEKTGNDKTGNDKTGKPRA